MMQSEETMPVDAIAHETGFSAAAVESMRRSVERGGGSMAQFDHAEFGGPGQWMRGGLLMIGSRDRALERRVGALCERLATNVTGRSLGPDAAGPPTGADAEHSWYPTALGVPTISGSQNALRYAWFAGSRRLAIDDGRRVTIRDTGSLRIGGVAQAQGASDSLTFTSQSGPVDLAQLPVVDGEAATPHDRADGAKRDRADTALDDHTDATTRDAPTRAGAGAHGEPDGETADPPSRAADDRALATRPAPLAADPFVALEKLAALHARGIVDASEFAAKKAELLKRI